jgi:hypothetical protein
MHRLLVAAVLTLAVATPAMSQNFAPQPPPVLRPGAPTATICSTDYGWCPLKAVAAPGGVCHCFVPPGTWLRGLARYWPYEGPVSPYLNPHQGPPATIR